VNFTTDPRTIEETRQHLRDGERLMTAAYSPRELYHQVPAVYPNGIDPGALWVSAKTLELAP
jgi:hypothetical protein